MKLKGIELKGTYKVKFGRECFDVFDEKGNPVYYENSCGIWHKIEYDEKGKLNYFENSGGYINDKRPKELSIDEIEKLLGYKIKIKGERKWINQNLN